MAIIKSYTDIPQSKKLAEILPIESADMHYPDYYFDGNAKGPCNTPYKEAIEDLLHVYINPKTKRLLPCWSLVALLDILDYPQLSKDKLGSGKVGWMVSVYPNDCRYDSCWHDNPIDACVDMIERLHELNLL